MTPPAEAIDLREYPPREVVIRACNEWYERTGKAPILLVCAGWHLTGFLERERVEKRFVGAGEFLVFGRWALRIQVDPRCEAGKLYLSAFDPWPPPVYMVPINWRTE